MYRNESNSYRVKEVTVYCNRECKQIYYSVFANRLKVECGSESS